MTNVKVSVIIPVYNAEKYLRQCLDSVCAQTLSDIEIICVDDGSTDSSPDILEDYAARDRRMQIIHQQNNYAGVARNNGMVNAKGDYLIFWDSDDFFESDALEKMYMRITADSADICVCGVNRVLPETGEIIPLPSYLNKKFIPKEIPFNAASNPDHILNFTGVTPWNKMFRRGFAKESGLQFKPSRNSNDVFFVCCALCLAESITIVNDNLINYRSQSGGLSSNISKANFDPINAFLDTARELKERGAFPERSFANRALNQVLHTLRNIHGSWPVFKQTFDYLRGSALVPNESGKENSVLDELCLTMHEPGYYYVPWQEKCLEHLRNDNAEEFLMAYLELVFERLSESIGNRRIEKAELRSTISELKNKNAELEKQNADLRKQLDEAGTSWLHRLRRK